MRDTRVGIAPADRCDAFAKNGLSLKRIPPQCDCHTGMIRHLDDEPVAIDPCNCGRAERENSVVGFLEQQAVKLSLVSGKHKIQDLAAPIGQNLVTARMPCDHNEDSGWYLSF